MVLFESLQSNYFEKLGLKLSLKLDKTISILYHKNQNVLDEIINIFNNSSNISYGSLIIDDILIQDLEIKERNNFFYNNISYCTKQNLQENTNIIKNIEKWSKLFYPQIIDRKIIDDYLDEFKLSEFRNIKIKKINENDKFFISFLLSILKKPKYVICNTNQSIEFKKIEQFLLKHNIDIKLIILTNTNQYKNINIYDLNNDKYFQNNPNLTFYSHQEIKNINHKNYKNNIHILFFIFKKTQIKNIFIFLLTIIFSTSLLSVSLFFNQISNQTYNYIITYLLIIITSALNYYVFTYQIFFKNKSNLINLNIEGFNYIFIILSSIITSVLTILLPLIISTIIIVILKFTTNFMNNVDIQNIYIPILVYFAITISTCLLSSIKLRIDINNDK